MEDDPEARELLQLLQIKMAAKQRATTQATGGPVDHEGDAGMGGDSQVAATAATAAKEQPAPTVTPPSAGASSTEVTANTPARPAAATDEIAAMRADMAAAAAQASAAKAQLDEYERQESARDAGVLQLKAQLAQAQAQATMPSQHVPPKSAEIASADADPPRLDHLRDSRSRSAERRKEEAKGKVLCR